MERKIGEIIEIKNVKYKCLEGVKCADCAFDFRDGGGKHFCAEHAEIIGKCASIAREDKIRIIFIEVKE